MAKAKEIATEGTPETVGYDPSEYEWDTVHTEAPDQLEFTTKGDTYIGKYEGHEIIFTSPETDPDEWFLQLKFSDPDGTKVLNAGYELRTTFVDISGEGRSVTGKDMIAPGTVTRIQLRKLVDIGQPSPMKSYQVDTAR